MEGRGGEGGAMDKSASGRGGFLKFTLLLTSPPTDKHITQNIPICIYLRYSFVGVMNALWVAGFRLWWFLYLYMA